MKRFVAKSTIFVLILWVASYRLAGALDKIFKQDFANKQFWVLSRHNLSIDYVVAGSSRAFNNIDIATFNGRIGQKGINIAFSGHSIMDMYLTIYLFLMHQNQVRHLVLQIDGADLDYSHKFLTHLYLPYTDDQEVAATLRDLSGLKHYSLIKLFPLAKYWEYNEFYNLKFFQQAMSKDSPYNETGGSELLFDNNYHVFQPIEQEPEFFVDSRSQDYLDRLVELARSRGIEITIFSAPMYHRDAIFKKYDQASRSYIARYCQEHSIRYLDFTDASFERFEFRDYGHLNGNGALRFTAMLAECLNEAE